MSMQTPSVGVLDITNATLRVGKLEVSSTQGIDSALNVFKANSILLFDNQRTSTTNPFTLSGSAIRNVGDFDSTSNIHLTSGSIYTGLGLPNAWSLEFDLYAPPSVDSGNVEVEFYSTASTGGGGYKVTFDTVDDSNQVILSYAGTSLTSQTAVIVDAAYRRVVIIYERGQISVSIGGTRVLHYKDIERPGPYTVGSAGFFRFAAPGAAVRRVRNIKISNDGPWSYTPNGGIAFLNGQVGIGTNSPTSNLEVAGSVKSRTMVVTGDSTFEDVVVSGNLTVSGTTTTVDTQNIQVTDPIIELGKDNDGSPVVDLGIVMTRPESNVAIIYDESAKSLEIGYTLNGASDSTITMDTANVFDMNVHGNVTMSGTLTLGEFAVVPSYGLDHVTGENNSTSDTIVSTNTVTGFQASSNIVVGRDALISGNLQVGTANLFVDTQTGRVTMNETKVSSNLEVGTSNLFVDTQTGRVGVGTDAPAYDLDVRGTANVSDLTVTSNVNLLHTANTSSLKVNSNVVTEFPRSKKLIKYPRVAMTGPTSGGYTASASSTFATYYPWRVFDNDNPIGGNSGAGHGWASQGPAAETDTYNATTGVEALATTHHSGSPQGEWIQIQMPESIYVHDIVIHSRSETSYIDNMTGFPKNVYLYGSNGNSAWTLIKNFTTSSKTLGTSYTQSIDYTSNAFKYFALVINTIHVSGTDVGFTTIGQIELYGLPEYDPQADGTDVKVKSIPNVPNTDWLEVYYDAKNLEDGTTTVNDLKPVGTAVNGTVFGNTTVSDGAFTFDGSGDYIESQNITTLSGNQVMSSSVWVKFNSWINANVDMVFSLGDRTGGNGKEYALAAYHSGTAASTNGLYVSIYGYNAITSKVIPDLNKWYHFVTTHDGSNHQIFINGVLVTSSVSNGDVSLPTSGCDLVLGGDTSSTRAQFMNGSIANFRLFNRALTSDEVWQLYAYQKEYFGHGDLGMTLKAGNLHIDGFVGTSRTGGLIIPSGTTDQLSTSGVIGMIRFNTELGKIQVYNGVTWLTIGGVNATGGTISNVDGYTIHTFTTSGTFTVTSGGEVEYLVVAGGGGGGRNAGAGGGAGGVLTGTTTLTVGSYTITRGTGGGGGNSSVGNGTVGNNSSIDNIITAFGGGYGANVGNGGNGGSGGGGSDGGDGVSSGGSGTVGQGNNGGDGNHPGGASRAAAGGGGAGARGGDSVSSSKGGSGGIGVISTIRGTGNVYYAGGGGGACHNSATGGSGGLGGGGKGGDSTGSTSGAQDGTDGTINTGGGGGGGAGHGAYGGNGGSGIVIIRYLS